MANTFVVTNRDWNGRPGLTDSLPPGQLVFLQANGDYEAAIGNFQPCDQATFVNAMVAELRSQPGVANGSAKAEAGIYIHGYNNSFDDALQELKEIGNNLRKASYPGLIILYTWPSEGQLLEYIRDHNVAMSSLPSFVNFFRVLDALQPVATPRWINLCMLAHSMGNLVLEESMRQYDQSPGSPPGSMLFNQTLMLAADIDNDAFEEKEEGLYIVNRSGRVTVYYSNFDTVLDTSSGVFNPGRRRLGRSGPRDYRLIADPDGRVVGVDTSYVNFAGSTNVHGAYRHIPACLNDMAAVIRGEDRAVIQGRTPLPNTGDSRRIGFYLGQPPRPELTNSG